MYEDLVRAGPTAFILHPYQVEGHCSSKQAARGWRNELIAQEAAKYRGDVLVDPLWEAQGPRFDLHMEDFSWREKYGTAAPAFSWDGVSHFFHRFWLFGVRYLVGTMGGSRPIADCTHYCESPLLYHAIFSNLALLLSETFAARAADRLEPRCFSKLPNGSKREHHNATGVGAHC